jgi:hypothetical protein
MPLCPAKSHHVLQIRGRDGIDLTRIYSSWTTMETAPLPEIQVCKPASRALNKVLDSFDNNGHQVPQKGLKNSEPASDVGINAGLCGQWLKGPLVNDEQGDEAVIGNRCCSLTSDEFTSTNSSAGNTSLCPQTKANCAI